jgi:hypothetical protein
MFKGMEKFVGSFLLLAIACVGLANAADPEVNMTGKWNVVTQLPIGPGNPSFDITQNGKQLTGTYRGALGEAPVTGSIEGNAFKFSFTAANVDCEYTGTLAGDEISGTLSLKGLGDGTFKGTRSP